MRSEVAFSAGIRVNPAETQWKRPVQPGLRIRSGNELMRSGVAFSAGIRVNPAETQCKRPVQPGLRIRSEAN